MPFAILASLIICTILYIAVSLVLTGMMRYDSFTGEDLKAPVAAALKSKIWVGQNTLLLPPQPQDLFR
jgi:APA family basic amino acid/polyamine antiporter